VPENASQLETLPSPTDVGKFAGARQLANVPPGTWQRLKISQPVKTLFFALNLSNCI